MRKLLLSLVLVTVYFWPTMALADETETPEPHIYQKKEIIIHKNLRNHSQQKGKIPEEQKQLTFEKSEVTNSEQMEDQLFQTAIQDNNTIQAKATQIGLFSDTEPIVKVEAETQLEENSSIILILMIAAVILVIGIMFVLILPKLQHQQT